MAGGFLRPFFCFPVVLKCRHRFFWRCGVQFLRSPSLRRCLIVIRNRIFIGANSIAHRVESATDDILLTIIFSASGLKKSLEPRKIPAQHKKIACLSVHGAAAIQAYLLKNSAESNNLSVYGRSGRRLARLPGLKDLRAIHQMLTAYCRITQSGPKGTSTTITNTDDRYAQSLL